MENPIQSDDSIQERIEAFLSAEDPQEEQAEPAGEAEPAETEVEQEPEGEGAEDEASLSISDLSKYLGIEETALDVDESGNLMLKTKVDGQEGKATLKDLITSYQLRSHLDNETRAAAEQRKALQAQAAEMEQAVQQRIQHFEDLANLAQMELNRQFQNVDWQTLRQTDPAEYAALVQDYQARQAQINNALQSVQAERQQTGAAQQARLQQVLQEEAKVLPALIPEWADAEVAQKERAEIREYALSVGIPKAEVDSVSRASHVALLRKAMLYDRLQAAKPGVEKRVTTAPRLVRPGQSVPRNGTEQTLKTIKANIRKTGGKDGIVEYLLASGKV